MHSTPSLSRLEEDNSIERKPLIKPSNNTTNSPSLGPSPPIIRKNSTSSAATGTDITLGTGIKGWFNRKILHPLIAVLRSGATAEGIALSLAFGCTAGLFPIPATTTVACLLLSWLFKLNFPAVQIMNLLMTPLNLATFLYFISIGNWLFNINDSSATISITAIKEAPIQSISLFGTALLRGVLVWLILLAPSTAIIYYPLKPLIRKIMKQLKFP